MFCGDNHSFDYTPTSVPNINNICIGNAIYDELYTARDAEKEYTEENKVWDFDTVFYAHFRNNLLAGNVDFSAKNVNAMRIKRRKKNGYQWITLFEIPIQTDDDFNFERFDRYARGNTEYEYSLVPMTNNIEGNLNTNSIKSQFSGYYITEKELIYHAFLNTALSLERNHNSVAINTLGRKFPFHISNGNSAYVNGELEATFIDKKLGYDYDIDNGWSYREKVDEFLTNGKPKILKNDVGQMWMIAVVENISHDYSKHVDMPIHSISWVEIGDPEETSDLYDNNFIDLDPRLVR